SRQTYWILQGITLAGAVVGAKIAMLAGDLGWPSAPVSIDEIVFSGKSIVGGLLGGFIAAELAKKPLGYREPPNDWFAAKLLLSMQSTTGAKIFKACLIALAGLAALVLALVGLIWFTCSRH